MANAKQQKIEIDGVTFFVSPFMAVEGLRLKAYLIRTIGPALGQILGGVDGSKVKGINELNLGGDAVTNALEKLLEQLDESSFVSLIERLFANVIANWKEDGKPRSIAFGTDFETAMQLVFVGKLFSIYPLILFILKVNYPDFFGRVVKGIGQKMPQTLTSETEDETSATE